MVTICTASLTFSNSTFYPHSVFMCFVWIWEQTAIIALHSINWLVFITEMECVYCAVRTRSFYINLILSRAEVNENLYVQTQILLDVFQPRSSSDLHFAHTQYCHHSLILWHHYIGIICQVFTATAGCTHTETAVTCQRTHHVADWLSVT